MATEITKVSTGTVTQSDRPLRFSRTGQGAQETGRNTPVKVLSVGDAPNLRNNGFQTEAVVFTRQSGDTAITYSNRRVLNPLQYQPPVTTSQSAKKAQLEATSTDKRAHKVDARA